jgi:hypothetical protein
MSDEQQAAVEQAPDTGINDDYSMPEEASEQETESVSDDQSDYADEGAAPTEKKERFVKRDAFYGEMGRLRSQISRMEEMLGKNQNINQQAQESPYATEDQSPEEIIAGIVDARVNEVIQKKQILEHQAKIVQRTNSSMSRVFEKDPEFNDVLNRMSIEGSLPSREAIAEAAYDIEDLGGFLRYACKNHSADLQVIAALPDKSAQVRQLARLDERIKLNARQRKSAATATSKPLSSGTGGSGDMSNYRPSSADEMSRKMDEEYFNRR